MKLSNRIVVLLVISSTILIGGGNVATLSQKKTVPVNVKENGFYVGLGMNRMALNNDYTDEEFSVTGLMLQAGYQYNQYLAIEGRYNFDIGDVDYDHGTVLHPDIDDYPGNFTNLAVYVKGTYPIGNFTPYVLLGYGEVALTNIPLGGPGISADRAEKGFQWGLGAGYQFTEAISFFVDYVRAYDGTGFDGRAADVDVSADIWTLGIRYTF